MLKIFKSCWILLFFIGSVLPLFRMNMEKITDQENRTLAKFPIIMNKGIINQNYGTEFESWLGDRFWGRDKLIDLSFKTLYKINGRVENDKALMGDDEWIFLTQETKKMPSFEWQKKDIKNKTQVLKDFILLFKKKDINIYVVLLPDKNEIYQKYWERYYLPRRRLDYGKEFEKALRDLPRVSVINTKKTIVKRAEKDQVFWKDDTHFTPAGVQLFLVELHHHMVLKELANAPTLLSKMKNIENMHHVAGTAAYLGFPGQVYDPYKFRYFYYETDGYLKEGGDRFKQIEKSLWQGEHFLNRFSYTKNPLFGKRLISIASCYGENVYNFLRPLYKESYWIRTNIGLSYGQEAYDLNKQKIKDILKIKVPATIVLTLREREENFEMFKDVINEVKNKH